MPRKIHDKKYTDWLSHNRIQRGFNLNNQRQTGDPEPSPPPPPTEITPDVPADYFLDRDIFNLRNTPIDLSLTDISEIPAWELQEYRQEEARREAAEERRREREELRQERRREREERQLEEEQRRLDDVNRQLDEEYRQTEERLRSLFDAQEPPRPISPLGLVPVMDAPDLGRPDVLPSTQGWIQDNPGPVPEQNHGQWDIDLEEVDRLNIVFLDPQGNWINNPPHLDRPITFRRAY